MHGEHNGTPVVIRVVYCKCTFRYPSRPVVTMYRPSLSTAMSVSGALWQNMLARGFPAAGLQRVTTPLECPACDTALVGL